MLGRPAAAVVVVCGVIITSLPTAKKEDPFQLLCPCLSQETLKELALVMEGRKQLGGDTQPPPAYKGRAPICYQKIKIKESKLGSPPPSVA